MGYLELVIQLLQEISRSQEEVVERAAQVMAGAIQADHLIYAFGATHASTSYAPL